MNNVPVSRLIHLLYNFKVYPVEPEVSSLKTVLECGLYIIFFKISSF